MKDGDIVKVVSRTYADAVWLNGKIGVVVDADFQPGVIVRFDQPLFPDNEEDPHLGWFKPKELELIQESEKATPSIEDGQ